VALTGWTADVSVVCSILVSSLFKCRGLLPHLERRPAKTNQRFSAAARRSHPAQGLIPTANVARLTTSPRPTSFSMMKPGSRIRRGRRSLALLIAFFSFMGFHLLEESIAMAL